jgi:hypothetical protein
MKVSLLLVLGCLAIHAGVVAYDDPVNQGVQVYTGNLALNFNVNSPITVTDLGVFNATGSGTIAGTIKVVIFDTVNNVAVTPVVTFHGSYAPGGLGFDVFQSISPVVLGPGSYQVDAVGFSSFDENGNFTISGGGPLLNDGGGLLTFTGAAYDPNSTLDQPATCLGCTGPPTSWHEFDAGTFIFQQTGVPEPATTGLLGTGLVGLAAMLRRRRR